jgi:hypothetical protein
MRISTAARMTMPMRVGKATHANTPQPRLCKPRERRQKHQPQSAQHPSAPTTPAKQP